jgi:hypothetical protein
LSDGAPSPQADLLYGFVVTKLLSRTTVGYLSEEDAEKPRKAHVDADRNAAAGPVLGFPLRQGRIQSAERT